MGVNLQHNARACAYAWDAWKKREEKQQKKRNENGNDCHFERNPMFIGVKKGVFLKMKMAMHCH